MGGGGSQVIGYHYMLTVVMNLCRGPINEMVEIEIGEETAWRGRATDSTPQKIGQPNLFGGEKREGGIQGAFRLLQGASDQVLPGDTLVSGIGLRGPVKSTVIKNLKTLIGIPMGEMRGYVTLVYDGLLTSISPYPKEWKMRVRRHTAGWYGGAAWYPAKARVRMMGDGDYSGMNGKVSRDERLAKAFAKYLESPITGRPFTIILKMASSGDLSIPRVNQSIEAMNPAHIIYQCITDPHWGAGKPYEEIDENSFILAANKLCEEGFGLCFTWSRQEDVDTFIQVVIDHIGGVVYNDRETGKYVLKLIRDDYNIEELPVYKFGTGLLRIEEEDNASDVEGINEVIVKGRDPINNEPFEVRVQNIASAQARGEIVSESKEYKGLPTRALGLRVAQRDLRAYSTGLKRFRVVLDRRAWKITPGSVIRVQAPEYGLADLVVRVGEVDYGDVDNREISCRVIEDVFGMPATSFVEPTPGDFGDGEIFPLPAPKSELLEAGYRDMYRYLGSAGVGMVPETSAMLMQMALSPGAAYTIYDLETRAIGETTWRTTYEQNFNAFAVLLDPITAGDTALTFEDNFGIDESFVGKALLLGGPGGEIVRFESYIDETHITVARGCADTVPQAHPTLTNVWVLDDTPGFDGREYAAGETVESQLLTRTRNALLLEEYSPLHQLTLDGRHVLPYPPGDVRVDGTSILELNAVYPEPVLTWEPRNRLTQADQLVPFTEPGVAAEDGTTYRIRIYNPADMATPLRTETGITATTWTYSAAMQGADAAPYSVVVRLDSERAGLTSWQAHEFTVQLSGGYGLAYGWDYGGA